MIDIEIDKKALFEKSYVDLATCEFFCENIDQLPTLYISCIYWLWVTKTVAEETSQHATGNLVDLIKDYK